MIQDKERFMSVSVWFKSALVALALVVMVVHPAEAGKKHAKAPSPNGGVYQAPAPDIKPPRVLETLEPPAKGEESANKTALPETPVEDPVVPPPPHPSTIDHLKMHSLFE